jgi:hypothetical protein
MKTFGIKFFILTGLLLTLSSGLLFYRTLFLSEITPAKNKNNFEELRYLDLKINEQMATERRHLESNDEEITQDLKLTKNKIHDLIFIIMDVHRNDSEIKKSVRKVESYFNEKLETITKFQNSMTELRAITNSLNSLFYEIQKKNIKFTLDKRDFYRECITDVFYYLSAPSNTNEKQLHEDKKILSQVIAISRTPEPIIRRYLETIDRVLVLNTEMEELFSKNKQKSINDEMTTINNYFKESFDSQNNDGQTFLILVFVSIIIYIISIVVIFRKY